MDRTQLSSAELETYRRAVREREISRAIEVSARKDRAWEIAKTAAQMLKAEFGATRVVVFGSLVHPELFHLHSDVDLAVWDVQHYFKAVSRLLDLDPEIEVDLVDLEDVRPSLQRTIETDGVEI